MFVPVGDCFASCPRQGRFCGQSASGTWARPWQGCARALGADMSVFLVRTRRRSGQGLAGVHGGMVRGDAVCLQKIVIMCEKGLTKRTGGGVRLGIFFVRSE